MLIDGFDGVARNTKACCLVSLERLLVSIVSRNATLAEDTCETAHRVGAAAKAKKIDSVPGPP
jgi:hypothetical protein